MRCLWNEILKLALSNDSNHEKVTKNGNWWITLNYHDIPATFNCLTYSA